MGASRLLALPGTTTLLACTAWAVLPMRYCNFYAVFANLP